MPDCAIFADTQDEPAEVYKWLEWLEPKLSFPVHRVTQGKLSDTATRVRVSKNGRKYTKGSIPAHIIDSAGSMGLMMRQCTTDFKIAPIYRQIRKLVGRKGTATQWLGISIDEVQRMKPARVSYVTNRWPLIEKRLTRQGCIEWMKAHGYPKPPRSACVYCPYHNDKEWLRLKTEAPADFQRAAEFEKAYQAAHVDILRGVPWLHRSHKPIDEVDFEPNKAQMELWGNECEGMCGV